MTLDISIYIKTLLGQNLEVAAYIGTEPIHQWWIFLCDSYTKYKLSRGYLTWSLTILHLHSCWIMFLPSVIDSGRVRSIQSLLLWDDTFIPRHGYLIDFWHRDLTSCLWLLFFMDYKDDDTLGSVFLAYLVWFGCLLTFVAHLYILPLASSYLYPSY